MKKNVFRLCSVILVIALLVNMLPMSIFAAEFREMLASAEATTGVVGSTEQVATADTYVVDELVEKRTEFSKEFLLSNGLHMATVYADAVHYESETGWKEIDNTLKVNADGTLSNTAGVWDVRFPQQLSGNESITIEKDGYSLSFFMAGELRSTGLETAGAIGSVDAETINESLTQIFETPVTQATVPETVPETTSAAEETVPAETGAETVPETTAAVEETVPAETVAETVPEMTVQAVPEVLPEQLSVTQMQTASAQIQQFDKATLQEGYKYAEAAPIKLRSRLTYENVYQNTNVVYDMDSNQVKESIVMAAYNSTLRGYKYTLHVGQMIPVLEDDGQVTLYDAEQKNVVMVMPAPYLVDAAEEYNHDIQVQLTGKGSTYTLTYRLPTQWLADAERAWPVILDPVVLANLDTQNIKDDTVSERNELNYEESFLEVGLNNNRGISRIFLKYKELPQLTSSDVIVDASVQLYKKVAGTQIQVNVHKVEGTWESNTLTWSNKPNFNNTIEDYALVDAAGEYLWNVTDIVQGWYTSQNTGMMFKATDAVEQGSNYYYKHFYSSDDNPDGRKPILFIEFRNNNGVENYWDYTASNAGRAGTGYINHYTGNLTWIRDDIGFDGNRMPVSIQHVYNLNDAIIPTDSNNSNDSGGNSFGMGLGWRTNYNQLVYHWNLSSNALGDYYIWEDRDGTDHYFLKESNGVYKDEDGLKMTLTTTGSGTQKYCITDEKDGKLYFDTYGRLTKIKNDQQTASSVDIAYTSATSKLISHIIDGAGRTYVFFYDENTRLLKKISYIGYNSIVELYPGAEEPPEFNYDIYEGDEISYVSFTYTDSNLVRITDKDGESSQFGYGENSLLTTAKDIDGYQLTYGYNTSAQSWQPYRVQSVAERDTVNEADGGTLTFAYGHNETTITDHNGNVEVWQFNDWGNTKSIRDDEGHATFADYARNKDGETAGKANQLRLSSKLQNTVGNVAHYSNFEYNTKWAYWPSDTSVENVGTDAYMGSRSILYTATKRSCLMSDYFPIEPGTTYTFSAYVKGVSGESTMAIVNRDTMEMEETIATQGQTEWTRVEVSFTNTTNEEITGCAQLFGNAGTQVYFDCAQIEKAETASRYNLVENGDFRYSGTWTLYGNTAETDGRITDTAAAPVLESTVHRITGQPEAVKSVQQGIPVSGNANDTYVLSGWSKGNSAPLTSKETDTKIRRFCLKAIFNNTDGTKTEREVSFNPDATTWQYVSSPVIADKAYSSITVAAVYDYNVNTVYFDGIQLFKEEFGSSYTYDEETGDLISVTDLQKKNTTYEYNTNGDITKILEDNKAKVEYTYYPNSHNVETATTAERIVYTFEYDTYGNNTKVTISHVPSEDATEGEENTEEGENATISSSAAYTSDGNYLISTTDALAKVTNYGYNINTGVLEWVQYPEDTAATRTEYTYDSMYRQATAECTTDTGLNQSVSYSYEDDRLTAVITPSTRYRLEYTDFGLTDQVAIGDYYLASHTYTNDRNRYRQRLQYGNGDRIDYAYDNKGRLLTETYEDGDIVSYAYDNNGALATVTDSATGRTTKYYYDLTDRMMKHAEQGTDFTHSVGYEYDSKNNLTQQVETINGTALTTGYTYDEDNRVKTVTTDASTVEYTYDTLGRIKKKITKHGTNALLTERYTYTPKSATESSAQVATHSIIVGSNETLYIYTYDNNGNILSITKQSNTVSYAADGSIIRSLVDSSTTTYTYDSANQLTSEFNSTAHLDGEWSYDDAGNIIQAYELRQDESGDYTLFEDVYTYGDSDWGDLLTSINGRSITRDNIGNPLTYGDWTYTWEHGRQLASMSNGSYTLAFEYDANGMRTKKSTVGTSSSVSYVYNGSQLTQMKNASFTLSFTYDANGTPLTLTLNGTVYYYVTNIQGDVVAILNANGQQKLRYEYDAWGNLVDYLGDGILYILNPLRYRGYVFDMETGLYYLQSRYYDPEMGRFINADAFYSTGQGFVGNNMFAYCNNNAIAYCDSAGYFPVSAESRITVDGYTRRGPMPYINNQNASSIKDRKLGRSTVGESGCGVVASYNALNELSGKSDFDSVLDWYNDWYPFRLANGGKRGVSIKNIVNFFESKNYTVIVADNEETINKHATTADASILYYKWDSGKRNPSYYGHFVYYHNEGTGYRFYNVGGDSVHFKHPSDCAASANSFYYAVIYIYN